MNLRPRLLLLALLCSTLAGLFGISAYGQQQNPALVSANLQAPLPFDTTVKTGVLKNGLRYYIRQNHKPEARAELRLVVNAGSVLEDENQRGLAHVVEHMAFSGTEHFKKQELVSYLESIGMRFGPDVNAYTSFDETVFMLELPTDTLSALRQGFQILEDWAHGITFDRDAIDRERKVVIEEWRLGRGADARIRDKQFPVLFKNSRYAERLPIGEPKILETFDPSLLTKFYADWYRPDLMAVVAVGDFDTTMIKDLILKHFDHLTNPKTERPRTVYPVPDHDQTLFAIASDSEATSSGIGIYFKRDTLPQWAHGDYRRQLVEGLFNGMLNFRLAELGRQADPPYLYGYVSGGRMVRSKAVSTVGASVKDGGFIRGLKTVLREVERARRFGFNQTELERQKSEQLRGMESAFNERDKTESGQYASEYIRNFLNSEPVPGIAYEYELYKSYFPGVSLKEVNALAADLMPQKNRVVAEDGPAKATVPMPTEAQIKAIIDSASHEEVTAYVDSVSQEPLLKDIPKPGKIAEERKRADVGVTEWTLSNGIRVVLKPTNFKNDQIQFTSFSPGGTSLAPDSLYYPAISASSIVEQGGLDGFDLINLQKKLTGTIASASPYIDELYEGLSGGSSVRDMETMFQLIYMYFKEPRKDSTAYLSYKSRLRAFLEDRGASPDAAFADTVQVTLAQYHPRRQPWTLETLDKLNLQKSFAFYKDRFADASDFTFLFVGNFTVDSIKPMVERYLGSLPALKRNEHWKDIGVQPPKGVIVKTVKRGVEPKSDVRLYFTGPFEWSIPNRFATNVLTEALGLKLHDALRVDKGGTYGVGVNGGPSRWPTPTYSLTISFGCEPSRVNEMVEATLAVLDSVKRFGLPESYLTKVRETMVRERETGLKQNGFWLSFLDFYYKNDEDPSNIFKLQDRIKLLSNDFLKQAAQRYFNMNNYFKAVLMPQQ